MLECGGAWISDDRSCGFAVHKRRTSHNTRLGAASGRDISLDPESTIGIAGVTLRLFGIYTTSCVHYFSGHVLHCDFEIEEALLQNLKRGVSGYGILVCITLLILALVFQWLVAGLFASRLV